MSSRDTPGADGYRLRLNPQLAVSLQRCVRLGQPSTSPPTSYGALPIWPADRAARRDLAADALAPAGDSEGFWIGLEPAADRQATALRLAVQAVDRQDFIDAITGQQWSPDPSAMPQNYVVAPPQRSLYGVSAGSGWARQFVAAVGNGHNAESAIARLRFMSAPRWGPPSRAQPAEPAPPQQAPGSQSSDDSARSGDHENAFVMQAILDDPRGITYWDFARSTPLTVAFVSQKDFTRRSGLPPLEPLDSVSIYGGWRLP